MCISSKLYSVTKHCMFKCSLLTLTHIHFRHQSISIYMYYCRQHDTGKFYVQPNSINLPSISFKTEKYNVLFHHNAISHSYMWNVNLRYEHMCQHIGTWKVHLPVNKRFHLTICSHKRASTN